MIKPFWKRIHDRLPTRIIELHPAPDFFQRPTTSKAKACFAINGADFDARRLNVG